MSNNTVLAAGEAMPQITRRAILVATSSAEERAAYHLEGLRSAIAEGHPDFEINARLKWDAGAAFVMRDPQGTGGAV